MTPQQILEARPFDARTFTIDCTELLAPGQTISSIVGVTEDSSVLAFANPVTNLAPATRPDTGAVIAIRQGIQVEISCTNPTTALGGAISALLTIRARFVTNTDRLVEATVQLFLTNTPGLSPIAC